MNPAEHIICFSVLLVLTTGTALAQVQPAQAPQFVRQWRPNVSSPFEVGTQIRAWTIHDEGMDTILDNMPLICGIAPRMKATPKLVKAGIKVALEHPAKVNGLVLKHYDGASFGLMRAFKQGMIEAGVQGLPPILGKDVEDMHIENFERVDDYVEEWGAATTGRGVASYRFDQPSGTYDIRVTYFDDTQGHSQVQLFVAGREALRFRLDEDNDCWRWRRFKNIRVNRGDEIKLVAEADRPETVRLDFIEFIPVKH